MALPSVAATAGDVVSNPAAKNITFLSGFDSAIFRASKGEYTTRTSAPSALARPRDESEPGTRIISPKEAIMTPGNFDIATALSISETAVTHTGQPGPDTRLIFEGRRSLMPLLKIATVWLPQTSMNLSSRLARA